MFDSQLVFTAKLTLIAAAALCVLDCTHDYGDAPDGGPTGYPQGVLVGGAVIPQVGDFPSLEASDGARVDSVGDITLGPSGTEESDALITNLDVDDGSAFLMVIIVSIPPPAQMIVEVTGHTPGTYFLNGLIDLNMNGEWGDIGVNGEQEWVVQNFPVTVGAGTTTAVTVPPFAFGWGNRLPITTWMRLALTEALITPGTWVGTGEFATGEVEDYFVTIALVPDDNGDDDGPDDPCDAKPVVDMNCNGPYRFPDGVDQIPVQCVITNLGGDGDVEWLLEPNPRCNVTLDPAADLDDSRPIACPGQIVLDFTATRADPLPCSWSYTADPKDPTSYMTATGLVAGYTRATGSFLLTGEADEFVETWVESLTAAFDPDAGSILARVELNEESLEWSEGAFVDFEIMYPDGALAQSRVELAGGVAETLFEPKGNGMHTLRVARLAGNHLDHVKTGDKVLMAFVDIQ